MRGLILDHNDLEFFFSGWMAVVRDLGERRKISILNVISLISSRPSCTTWDILCTFSSVHSRCFFWGC